MEESVRRMDGSRNLAEAVPAMHAKCVTEILGGQKSGSRGSKNTASAAPPNIAHRQVPPLSTLEPATIGEITKLLRTMPAKSCSLDPIPTWLLKRLTSHIAPMICLSSLQLVY